jgi:hypothetical protein
MMVHPAQNARMKNSESLLNMVKTSKDRPAENRRTTQESQILLLCLTTAASSACWLKDTDQDASGEGRALSWEAGHVQEAGSTHSKVAKAFELETN